MYETENNNPAKKHNGPSNFFLTLLRKNRDEVSITVATGEKHLGIIAGFDDVGIIMGVKIGEKDINQIYITRCQIVRIVPTVPVVYLSDY